MSRRALLSTPTARRAPTRSGFALLAAFQLGCGADPTVTQGAGGAGGGAATDAGSDARPEPGPVTPPKDARGLELVGELHLESPVVTEGYTGPTSSPGKYHGFVGDLEVHAASVGPRAGTTFAYLGSFGWRQNANETNWCPGASIKVVDLSDPTRPSLFRTLVRPEYSDSSAEDAEILRYATSSGETLDVLATGLQRCTDKGLAGMDLWDVSDPAAPRHLAFADIAMKDPGAEPCLDAAGRPAVRGGHEVNLFRKGHRVYALLSAMFREDTGTLAPFTGGLTPVNCGPEVLVYDITDPTAPARVADWGLVRDKASMPPLDIPTVRGQQTFMTAHAVHMDEHGDMLQVAYWDAGMILLDAAQLATAPGAPQKPFVPKYLGRTQYEPDAEGNAHSAEHIPVGDRPLVAVTDEDLIPPAYGYLRVIDVSNPAAPVQVGEFRTEKTASVPPASPGVFCAHYPVFRGALAAIGWYSDGVRLVDFTEPTQPVELGHLVTADVVDPFDYFLGADTAYVWGVAFADIGGHEYILASDMNFGLYVMRRTL